MQKSCLLFGAPSSGKSSLGNLLEKEYEYTHISLYDKTYNQIWKEAFKQVNQQLDNNYLGSSKIIKLSEDLKYELLYDKFKNINKLVFSDDTINIKKYYKDIIVFLLYASPEKMSSDINNKRLAGKHLSSDIFIKFSKMYIKTNDHDSNKIDKISLSKFIGALKKYNIYLFENEKDLITFAKNIFHNMNIYDSEEYYIKLRDNYKVDHIIDTGNQTKEKILNKLYEILK